MGKKAKKGGGKKGGKGKKGAKKEKKTVNRDEELQNAITNALLCKQNLSLCTRQRDDYRETCQKLASENEKISSSLYQAERDTIDIISLLKREDIQKFKNIRELNKRISELEQITDKEREKIETTYNAKTKTWEDQLAEKEKQVELLQRELHAVKEFRKQKAQLMEEIKDMRNELEQQRNLNTKNKQKMEHKFFVEKMKMENEASQKIAQYAELAQKEAIAGLDETTRKVFRDNVSMSEVMNYHIEENKMLREKNKKLERKIKTINQELEISDLTAREKVSQHQKAKDHIRNLMHEIKTLNNQLKEQKRDNKNERALVLHKSVQQSVSDQADIARLSLQLQRKELEYRRVKTLAKKVVDERAEMERFFIEALDEVAERIKDSRQNYVKSTKTQYHAQMAAAAAGRGAMPSVKTFSKGGYNSTNTVQKDIAEASDWNNVPPNTDISDLTWEQKERVIRLLFAKMNGVDNEQMKVSKPPLPPLASHRIPPEKVRVGASIRTGSGKSVLSEIALLKSQNETPLDSSIFITQETVPT
ncbi:unnamed protein product [Oikopleura dioica]|uniref:Basal body-orientation factor 1 n=1 Tax=Oikopleura dioica TaxID=34765 RepID=E4XBC1_OIKDI|nr:unnamed protein product [Oikopleura dioica]